MLKILTPLILLTGALAAAYFVFTKFDGGTAPEGRPTGHIAEIVPAKPGVWESEDMPLGSTEEVKRSAEKILATSEFLNRRYSDKSGREFNVYIAYWEPGKVTPRHAVNHTPDSCWVRNGWKRIDNSSRSDCMPGKQRVPLFPAFYREYTYEVSAGKTVKRNVVFWCVIGDETFNFSEGGSAFFNPVEWFKSILKYSVTGMKDIYFIRVDSSFNFDDFKSDEGFNEVMDSLGKLALSPKREEVK